MPEKALKMMAWNTVGRHVEQVNKNPLVKWVIAGCAAGAATTVVGRYDHEHMTQQCVCDYVVF